MNKLSAIISFLLAATNFFFAQTEPSPSPIAIATGRREYVRRTTGIQSERDFAPGISPRRLKGGATAVIMRGPSVPKTPAGCDFVFLTCQVQNQISKEHNRSAGKRLE
ncbi:MAG: hypothetical protein DMF16_07390 [Verrucomicrobia bacterium]|nr:MAG: hypothetical protein DMF16_07390 [Verrucomicrobiota bacterium]